MPLAKSKLKQLIQRSPSVLRHNGYLDRPTPFLVELREQLVEREAYEHCIPIQTELDRRIVHSSQRRLKPGDISCEKRQR